MAPKSVLVVDDDPKVRSVLRRCLEVEGYEVREAVDGAEVRRAFAANPPDLVTLDLNLGAEDGLEIARSIRQSHDTAILMVTGKDDVIDRIVGLELGADDYLTKPFHVREVLARVRTILRRTSKSAQAQPAMHQQGIASVAPAQDRQVLELDGLQVDLDRRTVTSREGEDCDLTSADFKLLVAFIEHAKRPLTRDTLMDLINGQDWTPLDRTIDNQVARLRKKIERDAASPRLIRTVRGVGYVLTESAVPLDYPPKDAPPREDSSASARSA